MNVLKSNRSARKLFLDGISKRMSDYYTRNMIKGPQKQLYVLSNIPRVQVYYEWRVSIAGDSFHQSMYHDFRIKLAFELSLLKHENFLLDGRSAFQVSVVTV